MKLQEMLHKCDLKAVLDLICSRHDCKTPEEAAKCRAAYDGIFHRLLKLKPKTNKKETWTLYVTSGEDGKESYDGDVCGYKEEDGERYGLDFSPWREWLAMPVVTNYSVNETIAYVLWEMTFYGYNEKKIQAQARELRRRVKEIDNGTAKLVEFKDAKSFLEEISKQNENKNRTRTVKT
jgi:hypothetical protein